MRMNTAFIKILNMSIAASWLILAVIILRALLRRSSKWIRCILWGIVAVRLICPFSPESKLSLIPSVETIPVNIVRHSSRPIADREAPVSYRSPDPVVGETLAPGLSGRSPYGWTDIAGPAWMAGTLGLLIYALVLYLRLRKKVSEAVLFRDNIWMGDAVKAPFILGIIRPRIYLSSGTEESQLRYVLAHEQAHLKRRDHWWKLLGYLLLSIYWFNPLSWAAYILFCRDIELACDEKVIRGFEERERKSYSNALLSCSMQRKLVVSYPLAFGETAVKERVKSVMNYKKPAFLLLSASLAICMMVAVCFLTNPVTSRAESNEWNPEVEWWTYEEYAEWLENEKKELSGIIGSRSWTPSTGWYTWTQERVDEAIARYEEILQQIKDGCKVSKTVNGSEDTMLMQGAEVHAGGSEGDEGDEITAVGEAYAEADISGDYISELLNAYESFGLRCDEAGKAMYFNGKMVRYFYDGVDIGDGGAATVYEFLNENGVVDVYTVREATENEDGSINPVGRLTGILECSQEEFDSRDIRALTRSETIEAVAAGTADSADAAGGRTFEEVFSEYKDYGITYVEAAGVSGRGNVYYNGQLVDTFIDETPDGGMFFFQSGETGSIAVRTVYSSEGKLSGIEIIE